MFEYWLEQVPWAGEPSRVLVARVDNVGFPLGVRSDGSDTITVLLMDERQSRVDIFQYDAAGLELRTRSSFIPPEARMFGLPGAAFSDGGVLTVLYRHTFRKTTDGPPFVLTLVATGPPAARQP